MNLILLTTLKARLGISDASVDDDETLEGLIAHASAIFDRETNRTLAHQATAQHEFDADRLEIFPACYPIDTDGVAAWHLKVSEAEGWEEQTGVDYLIRKNGAVISLENPVGSPGELARLTYAGGYIVPDQGDAAEGQTALPDDLAEACLLQCMAWYQQRNALGITSQSGPDGSVTRYSEALLPRVKLTLAKYRRLEMV